MYVRPHLICKVGGVKCQPFLKRSNHWKWALKTIFKGSGYCVGSSILRLVLSTRVKKSMLYPNTIYYDLLYPNTIYSTQTRSTTIYSTQTRSTTIYSTQTRSTTIYSTQTRSTTIYSTQTHFIGVETAAYN